MFTYRVALTSEAIPLCVGWPVASRARRAGPLPAVPTLILDGASDVRTPVADAQSVAGRIPGSQLVPVPYVGHSVLGSDFSTCSQGAVDSFLGGEPVAQCDPAQGRLFTPTGIAPTRLGKLPGRTKASKTVAAPPPTVVDVRAPVHRRRPRRRARDAAGDRAAGLRVGHRPGQSAAASACAACSTCRASAVSGFVPATARGGRSR